MDRRTFGAALSVAALGLLTGCNSSADSSRGSAVPTGSASGSSSGGPVSIRTALGTATIGSRPSRVVTLGWGSDDASLALGVKPVGMSINLSASADGLTPWARTALGPTRPQMFSADTDSVPYEKIAALQPDVILAVYSGVTAEQYGRLSQIAPTVGYPSKPWATAWPEQLALVGRALGREAEATRLTAQVRRQIAAQAAAHPEFSGLTAIFGSVTQPGSVNLYLPDDPRMQLLGQLGFTVSDAASTTFPHPASSPSFATAVSLEEISKLETDVLICWYFSAASADQTLGEPLFARLPAVRRKAYLPITDPALVFASSAPNVLSIPWMLERYLPMLATAAGRAG